MKYRRFTKKGGGNGCLGGVLPKAVRRRGVFEIFLPVAGCMWHLCPMHTEAFQDTDI